MTTLYVIFGVIIVVILWLVLAYNRLVRLRQQVVEALSDIEVQLKRRFDLIPNLVETVKGYAGHERGTLEEVTRARTQFMSARTTKDQVKANDLLTETLKTLFAVSERYPDLKANINFLELQRELEDTENKIQAARRFANTNVRDLNIAVQSFPTNVIAGMFGFVKMDFFEAETPEERKPVHVKF